MYKIKNEYDLRTLQERYGDDVVYRIHENGEELPMPQILFGYDSQEFSVEII